MTDEQIIKANKMCALVPQNCQECPYVNTDDCVSVMTNDTIDFINRLQEEIEKLNKALDGAMMFHSKAADERDKALAEVERLYKEVDRLSQCVLYHDGQIADAKAEAIKEFAEKVKTAICQNTTPEFGIDGKPILTWSAVNGYDDIDNLVKEMAGEG